MGQTLSHSGGIHSRRPPSTHCFQLNTGIEQDAQDYRRRLGDVIWNMRTKRGLTQKGAAEAAGVTRQFYGLLERGEINVSLDTLIEICSVLSTTPAQLFSEVEREGR